MPNSHPDRDMIALGIRQPWAELILRGVKTIEVRTQDTNVRGPIYLYASKKIAEIEAAADAAARHGIDMASLPRGVIVGTVEIRQTAPATPDDAPDACVPPDMLVGCFGWRLVNPTRFDKPLTVRFLPYGVWFYPWKRRRKERRGRGER